TDGWDADFGETLAPNFPGGSDGFAGFVYYDQGLDWSTLIDIRSKPQRETFSIQYEPKFEPGEVTSARLTWDPAAIPPNVRELRVNFPSAPYGLMLDLRKQSSFDLTKNTTTD